MRDPIEHELKTWPRPFQAVWDDLKPFEIRKDDRDFQVGDTLMLREFVPCVNGCCGSYTGRSKRHEITYLVRGPEWGIPFGLVVLGMGRSYTSANAARPCAERRP